MWRLLLQAGVGFATFDVGRRIVRLKRMAIYVAVAGLFALLGLGALTAGGVLYLEPRFGAAEAAAIVGGGLIVLAALVGWIGTWKPTLKAPTPVFDRVRAEIGAAGSALSSARTTRAARVTRDDRDLIVETLPVRTGARKKRALNMVLIATLAGVVLGRKL